MLSYSKSSSSVIIGKYDLQSLDQVLAFNNLTVLEKLALWECPPLEFKHLLMLTSLKELYVKSLDGVVVSVGGEGDVEWQLSVEHLVVIDSRGKESIELLTHLPRLSKLEINGCKKITQLAVGVDVQQTMSAATATEVEEEREEDGLLLLPAHLCDSLRELVIQRCPDLVLVDPPSTFLPATGGGGLQALRSLQSLRISNYRCTSAQTRHEKSSSQKQR